MKQGFTLSEILITLGIVGVVAVLTVPSVMKNYRNRMYVSQLQKIYSQLSDAAQAIMHDEHVDSFYETSAANKKVCTTDETTGNTTCTTPGTEYFLNTYFKSIKKDCSKGSLKCTVTNYNTIAGANLNTVADTEYCIQTVNGATICSDLDNSTGVFEIMVDVNGPAVPNIAGRDTFGMIIKSDGSVSDYTLSTKSKDPEVAGCTANQCNTSTGSVKKGACGCLNSIIEAGWKMEY